MYYVLSASCAVWQVGGNCPEVDIAGYLGCLVPDFVTDLCWEFGKSGKSDHSGRCFGVNFEYMVVDVKVLCNSGCLDEG
jgi:hypothetical protein